MTASAFTKGTVVAYSACKPKIIGDSRDSMNSQSARARTECRAPATFASRSSCAYDMRIHYGGYSMGAKKAVNVSIQSELLDAARAEDINLSATLEAALVDQLRVRKRDRWRSDNEAAIEAYNIDVDENGAFGDHVRGF
jgi:antitoxin CcdA